MNAADKTRGLDVWIDGVVNDGEPETGLAMWSLRAGQSDDLIRLR
jgi:hypothetical protein